MAAIRVSSSGSAAEYSCSSITGATNSIFNDSSSGAKVADTALVGGSAVKAAGTGVLTCVEVYNAAFVALGTS